MGNLSRWAARQRAPFTLFLIGSLVLVALYGWAATAPGMGSVVLTSDLAFSEPWRLLLYPWAATPLGGLPWFVLFLFWLWWVGGPTEQAMGSGRFAAYWFGMTALIGLAVVVGARLVGTASLLGGPWPPEAAVTVLWCARNRAASVRLWFVLPVNGAQLALLTAGALVFMVGLQHPLVGVLAGLPLLGAWAFGRGRFPIAVEGNVRRKRKDEPVVKGGTKYDDSYFENVKDREIERAERERLRKLFEGK